MNKQVIAWKVLPSRLPIWPTIVVVLAMDHWKAPLWLWGSVVTVLAVIWLAATYGLRHEEDVDPIHRLNCLEERVRLLEKERGRW